MDSEISRRWFSVRAAADGAEVSIFDEVGLWGVTVADFKKELDAVKDSPAITLYLNSVGGSVFDGMALYNLLLPLKDRLTVRVLGLAASIASIIALAGKRLIMADGAYLMIHNPVAGTIGSAEELRKTAELLDKIRDQMADLYSAKSRKSRREVRRLMDEETWFTAEEAVEAGFADEVDRGAAALAARGDLSRFQHAPRAVIERITMRKFPPATARDFERHLRDTGYSRTEAMRIVAGGFSAARVGSSSERAGRARGGVAAPSGSQPITAERQRETQLRIERLLGNHRNRRTDR